MGDRCTVRVISKTELNCFATPIYIWIAVVRALYNGRSKSVPEYRRGLYIRLSMIHAVYVLAKRVDPRSIPSTIFKIIFSIRYRLNRFCVHCRWFVLSCRFLTETFGETFKHYNIRFGTPYFHYY